MTTTETVLSPKPKFLDRFMNLLFRFGKTFAGFLAVLCLLSVILSLGVFAWNLRSSFDVPEYRDLVSSGRSGSSDPDTSNLEERRAVEKKFGDEIMDLVKEYKMNERAYDMIIGAIIDLDEDYRSKFVGGLEEVLEDRADAQQDEEKNVPSVSDLVSGYMYAFSDSEMAYDAEREIAKGARWTALTSTFASCVMLFMMLIIPALIKIEENTRRS